MNIVELVVGVILLISGRRLYWLFIGALGFFIGMEYANYFYLGSSETVVVLIALGLGVLGIIFAIWVQKFTIFLGGVLAGGWVGAHVIGMLGLISFSWVSVAVVLSGVIGGILMLVLFDVAIVVLSSLIGAILIMEQVYLTEFIEVCLYIVLIVFGVLVQQVQLNYPKEDPEKKQG